MAVRALVFVVAAAAGLSASFAHRAAHACSPPSCRKSWSAPAEGKTIPANAPALVFKNSLFTYSGIETTGSILLKNASGTIATTVDGEFLRPIAPLPVGPVTLEYDEGCFPPFGSDAGVLRSELTFTVGPASPLPTSFGTATVTYSRAWVPVVTYSGSCTDSVDAAVARVQLALDPSFEKFRDVARFTTRVDGAVWNKSAWGREGPIANPFAYFMDSGVKRHDLIFATCGAIPSGVDTRGNIATGKHTVELRAEIAGASVTLPAVSFEIDLQCGSSPPDAGAPPDAAALPDVGGSEPSGDTGYVDPGPKGDAAASAPSADDDVSSSCSVGHSNGTPIWLAIAASALALLRRRRALDTAVRDR